MGRETPAQWEVDAAAAQAAAEREMALSPPLCACKYPERQWSDVYGTGSTPRRIYWRCTQCGDAGVVCVPPIGFGSRFASELDRALAAGDLSVVAEMTVHQVEDFLYRTRRGDVQTSRLAVAAAREVVSSAIRRLDTANQKRREEIERDALMVEAYKEDIDRRQKEYERRARSPGRRMLRRRKPVSVGPFPTLVSGGVTLALDPAIYGLVDPRDPARVRYVGQALRPVLRLAGHIDEAEKAGRIDARDNEKRAWIRSLIAAGSAPDMVLLERVPKGALMSPRENWWIRELRTKGQADLNTSLPRGLRAALRERTGDA